MPWNIKLRPVRHYDSSVLLINKINETLWLTDSSSKWDFSSHPFEPACYRLASSRAIEDLNALPSTSRVLSSLECVLTITGRLLTSMNHSLRKVV